jgi:hypothetical protein
MGAFEFWGEFVVSGLVPVLGRPVNARWTPTRGYGYVACPKI